MTIDYVEFAKLVDTRKKQIQDISLEMDIFNEEYIELEKIRVSLAKLILLQRDKKRLQKEIEEIEKYEDKKWPQKN